MTAHHAPLIHQVLSLRLHQEIRGLVLTKRQAQHVCARANHSVRYERYYRFKTLTPDSQVVIWRDE